MFDSTQEKGVCGSQLVQAVFEYIQQQYLRNPGHLGRKQSYARVKLVDPAKSRLEVRDSYYYECCQQAVIGRA